MKECQLHLYIHPIASLVFGMYLQHPVSRLHSSSVRGLGGGDLGDRNNVGSIFSPLKIIRKTLVLLRGRESWVA